MTITKECLERCACAGFFLDLVEAAFYFCDLDGRFQYINKTAEKLDGYTQQEIQGKTVMDAYNLDDTPMLRALYQEKPIENITFRYNVNGVNVMKLCNARPFYINGEKMGAFTVQRDVTKLNEVIESNILMQQRMSFVDSDQNFENKKSGFQRLIGQHPSFVKALSDAVIAAQNDSPVLLTGSTGSGKELFAQCIHNASARREKPFLAINCAAIPQQLLESILFGTSKGAYTGAVEKPGLFEQAEGGTLFLDEINSMPKYSQSKLLRVLEENEVRHLGGEKSIPVNVRIISSNNHISNTTTHTTQLREDLFYRLAVINIVIPDLAERKSDIPLLVNHFIDHYNHMFHKNVQGLDWETNRLFYEYSWPGNVRQLKNCLESAMNFVDHDTLIGKKHLPQYLLGNAFQGFTEEKPTLPANTEEPSPPQTSSDTIPKKQMGTFEQIREQEKNRIIEALFLNNGNITKTAKYLDMPRQSLVYRIKKYEIK